MIKMHLICDYCNYRDSADEITREWITVSNKEQDFHFCSKQHLFQQLEKELKKHE